MFLITANCKSVIPSTLNIRQIRSSCFLWFKSSKSPSNADECRQGDFNKSRIANGTHFSFPNCVFIMLSNMNSTHLCCLLGNWKAQTDTFRVVSWFPQFWQRWHLIVRFVFGLCHRPDHPSLASRHLCLCHKWIAD